MAEERLLAQGGTERAGRDSGEAGDPRAVGPITVLQVLPRLNSGGVERGTLEVAEALAAAGGRALAASEGGRLEALLRRRGGELFKLPLATKNPLKIRRNAARLLELIRAENVDIVHARSRAPAWSALWAARRAGVPLVTTYHGVYAENLPFKRRYNAVMAAGDRVIAISDFIAERVRRLHGTPEARIVVIPRGADPEMFDETAVAPGRLAALSKAWGVADDHRPVIALPGRLTRWKGQELFLDAVAHLRARLGSDSFLALLIGGDDKDGRFSAQLQARIETRGIADCARMVGHCDDMPAAYRLMTVAVSASLEPEAFGRVAVEAQAMATPIIAAAHGGATETVIDDETGWLVPPQDAEALAAAMERALTLPLERLKSIGAAGAAHARARFSTTAMQAATLQVYEELAGRRLPGRRAAADFDG